MNTTWYFALPFRVAWALELGAPWPIALFEGPLIAETSLGLMRHLYYIQSATLRHCTLTFSSIRAVFLPYGRFFEATI
jgi:hypothetical protein